MEENKNKALSQERKTWVNPEIELISKDAVSSGSIVTLTETVLPLTGNAS